MFATGETVDLAEWIIDDTFKLIDEITIPVNSNTTQTDNQTTFLENLNTHAIATVWRNFKHKELKER